MKPSEIVCPVCKAVGQVRDKKTRKLRLCLGCNGKGVVEYGKKPPVRVKNLSRLV